METERNPLHLALEAREGGAIETKRNPPASRIWSERGGGRMETERNPSISLLKQGRGETKRNPPLSREGGGAVEQEIQPRLLFGAREGVVERKQR
jgi:hypothetical protein